MIPLKITVSESGEIKIEQGETKLFMEHQGFVDAINESIKNHMYFQGGKRQKTGLILK